LLAQNIISQELLDLEPFLTKYLKNTLAQILAQKVVPHMRSSVI
jgi:hypothetical protein